MLVRFRSEATESITMFGDVAQALLKLMGATGNVPGALGAEDVADALSRLEREVESMKAAAHATSAPPADNEDAAADEADEDATKQAPVSLATRAIPLLSLMKRAAAARVPVVWEKQ